MSKIVACRQRHKRGVPYESVYAVWNNPQEQADVEYLALLAENDRSTFAALQRMKEKYGRNAMLAALHILQDAK